MALLVFAILNVMCCYFCYFVGTQKGYNGLLCAFAGLFGSFLACLILLLMPDKASDTFNSAAYNREVSELRQQVKDMQKRILCVLFMQRDVTMRERQCSGMIQNMLDLQMVHHG